MLFVGVILLIIVWIVYFKIKYPFWSKQPVFHYHNLWYWLFPPGIITHTIPPKNKYYDSSIQFTSIHKANTVSIQDFITLIQNHYLRTKKYNYVPNKESILANFKGIEKQSILGIYYQPKYIQNIVHNKPVSVLTGRPLRCYLHGNMFTLHYVDFLCIHKKHRKQRLAPKIIYSYYVTQRNRSNNPVFLFKRESSTTSIVPLTTYSMYFFPIHLCKKPRIQNVIALQTNELSTLYSESIKSHFSCFCITPYENLFIQVKTKSILIYALVHENVVKGYYFFRNTHTTTSENDKETKCYECFASICLTSEIKFYYGFLNAVQCVKKDHGANEIQLENISNNNLILKYLIPQNKPTHKTPCSYYFYNFAYLPIQSNKVCCIF